MDSHKRARDRSAQLSTPGPPTQASASQPFIRDGRRSVPGPRQLRQAVRKWRSSKRAQASDVDSCQPPSGDPKFGALVHECVSTTEHHNNRGAAKDRDDDHNRAIRQSPCDKSPLMGSPFYGASLESSPGTRPFAQATRQQKSVIYGPAHVSADPWGMRRGSTEKRRLAWRPRPGSRWPAAPRPALAMPRASAPARGAPRLRGERDTRIRVVNCRFAKGRALQRRASPGSLVRSHARIRAQTGFPPSAGRRSPAGR
jgi:hypothetical protein